MSKSIRFVLISYLMAFCMPLFAQKTQPVVDKETIKKVQQELKAQMPNAKIKTIKNDNGSVYIGEVEKKAKQGMGVMFFSTGDVYIGQWESDAIFGHGTMTYANGDKYEGEWKMEERDGAGTMTYANGDKYEGEWKRNNYDGRGVKTFTMGDILKYDGEWKDGKMQGEGKAYDRINGNSREGLWDNNRFSKGLWTFGSIGKMNGQLEGDYFTGDGKLDYGDGWTFDGIISIDLNKSEGNRSLMIKKGILSNGTKISYNGVFSSEPLSLTSGTVNIDYGNLSLFGNVMDDSLTGRLSFSDQGVYDGVFSSKDSFGTLKDFEGTYSVVIDDKTTYTFNGKMVYHRPVEGVLDTGRSKVSIKVNYDSNDQASVSVLGSDEYTIPYIDNRQFFNAITEKRKTAIAGFKPFDGVVYIGIIEDTPLDGVDEVFYWAFFDDGVVERYHKYIPSKHKDFVYKSKPKGRIVTCPSCHGEGTIIESGYTVAGEAYKKKITCQLCNGKGKTDDELSNILDEGLSNFWEEVGTMQQLSDGRTAKDVLKEVGVEYIKYTVSSRGIHLDTKKSPIKDFTWVSGSLVCKQYPSFILKPLSDSKSLYDVMKKKATESYYYSASSKVDIGIWKTMNVLPFSIPVADAHIYNNEIIYKADYQLTLSTNARVLWDYFKNGTGYIGLDRSIEVCMISSNRDQLVFCEQIGYKLISDKCWVALSERNYNSAEVKELQLPSTIKDIGIVNYHMFSANPKIILPLATPPRINYYFGSNFSRYPDDRLKYCVPEKNLKAFYDRRYWRERIERISRIYTRDSYYEIY